MCHSQLDTYSSEHWWEKALEWSCDASMSSKLVEAVAMEMNTMPSHIQVAVGSTEGLQYLLLEEVEKLVVRHSLNTSIIRTLVHAPHKLPTVYIHIQIINRP